MLNKFSQCLLESWITSVSEANHYRQLSWTAATDCIHSLRERNWGRFDRKSSKISLKTWRKKILSKKLSQKKVRWLIGHIGSAETLACPVLSCLCPVLSCQTQAKSAKDHSFSSSDLFVLWDEMNASVCLGGVLTSRVSLHCHALNHEP